jgi:hypothetical protein
VKAKPYPSKHMLDSILTIDQSPRRAGNRTPSTSTELLVLLAVSGVAALVPWLSKYWLFDHAPNNLAATHILQSLSASPDGAFAQHFVGQLRVVPYTLFNWLLLALSPVTGLVDAHRIIVSTLVIAQPASVYVALRRLAPERRANAWLYAPLGMTIFTGGGMQGFSLSLPPMLVAWAMVCGARPEPGRRRAGEIAIAALLFLVSTFAHPVGPVLGAVAIALFQWRRMLHPRTLVEAGLALIPAFAWVIASELASRSAHGGTAVFLEAVWSNAELAWHYFVWAFTVTSQLEVVVRVPVFALCAWGTFRALKHDRARTLPFARIALFFLVLLLLGPLKIGGATVVHRFAALLVIFVIFCVDLPPMLSPRRLALVALATAIAVAAVQIPNARHADAAFDEVIAIGEHIPRGATVFPLSFERNDLMHAYRRNLQPWSYLVLSRDIITPYITAAGAVGEAGNEFRALAYRHRPSTEYLPAPVPRHATDDTCRLLGLSSAEDCRSWRTARYRSYVAQALHYDLTLVFDPPAELVAELQGEMILDEHRGDVWLFRPRPQREQR